MYGNGDMLQLLYFICMLNNVRWKRTKHGVYDRIWNLINWIDL